MSGIGDIFSGIGSLIAAGGYDKAGDFARQNAKLSELSTGVQLQAERRQAYQVIGGQQADIASSGLANSGSALNVVRSTTQQLGLQRGLTALQGQIDVNNYNTQAASYDAQADASRASGFGSIIGGITSFIPGL